MDKELRLLPKGKTIFSISNQINFITENDIIVEVGGAINNSTFRFAKQKQLIFNMIGFIPTAIGKGSDEWMLNYDETLPYSVPEPCSFDWSYNDTPPINL
jgi:hypothetical protein